MFTTVSVALPTHTLLTLIEQLKRRSGEFARAFARTNRNAWLDLKIRRPGDKQFKLAAQLRKEVLREQEDARKAKASLAAQAIAPLQAPAALAPPAPVQPPRIAQPPQPATPRDTKPGEGWSLPERRHWRFRLEDVAFD